MTPDEFFEKWRKSWDAQFDVTSVNFTACPVCGQRIWTTRDKDRVMATCSADGDFFWTVVNGRLVPDPRPKVEPDGDGRPIGRT